MKHFIKAEVINKRSQDLEKHYRLNGAIYIAEYPYFYANNGFMGDETKASIMSIANSVDIDTQLDFDFANFILQQEQS